MRGKTSVPGKFKPDASTTVRIFLLATLCLSLYHCMLGSSTDTDNAKKPDETETTLANTASDTVQVVPAESLSLIRTISENSRSVDTIQPITVVVDDSKKPSRQTTVYIVTAAITAPSSDPVYANDQGVVVGKVFQFQGGLLANVEDATGAPLTGAMVKVAPADTFFLDKTAFLQDTATSAVSDTNGIAVLENLAPGHYLATGFLPGSQIPAFFYPVEIGKSKSAYLRMRPQQVKPFTGRVTRQSGLAPDSILTFLKGTPYHAYTDTAGRFDMGLLPTNLPAVGFRLSDRPITPPETSSDSGKNNNFKGNIPPTAPGAPVTNAPICSLKQFTNNVPQDGDIKKSLSAEEPVFTILDLDSACAQ